MRLRQVLVCATVLLLAAMIQLTLLARLQIPGSTPDLVVVSVVALGLAYGPVPGAVAGFWAGLILGMSPPADGILGILALIYLVVGYLSGSMISPRDRTLPLVLALVGMSTGGAALANVTLTGIFGGERVIWDQVPAVVLSSVFYGVLLTPVIVPLVGWLKSKVTPELVD